MAGGGGGNTWIKQLVAGGAMLVAAAGMHMAHVGNGSSWSRPSPRRGWIPALPRGGALHIDLQTTSVVLLGFPPMLVLWKAIQDDGAVNWVETATMIAIFALTLFFLGSE